MEEEVFIHIALDRGGDKKPRFIGVFYFYKKRLPKKGSHTIYQSQLQDN
tara:strand:- start:196 stop:342 length:147 start_codon:yes stop_codon:yes gene_type:complete